MLTFLLRWRAEQTKTGQGLLQLNMACVMWFRGCCACRMARHMEFQTYCVGGGRWDDERTAAGKRNMGGGLIAFGSFWFIMPPADLSLSFVLMECSNGRYTGRGWLAGIFLRRAKAPCPVFPFLASQMRWLALEENRASSAGISRSAG